MIPNGFAFGTGIFLAAKGQYAPLLNQHVCYIGIYPPGCLGNPDVDCQRGSLKTPFYAKVLAIIPLFVTYFLAIVITIIILCTVVKQKRRADRWRMRGRQESTCSCQDFFTRILGLGPKQNEQTSNSPSKIETKTELLSAKFAKMANSLALNVIPNSKSSESLSTKSSSLLAADVENNIITKISTSRSGSKKGMLLFLYPQIVFILKGINSN